MRRRRPGLGRFICCIEATAGAVGGERCDCWARGRACRLDDLEAGVNVRRG